MSLFTVEECAALLADLGAPLTIWQIRKLGEVGAVVPPYPARVSGASALYDVPTVALFRAHGLLASWPDIDVRPTFLARAVTTREAQSRLRRAVATGERLALVFDESDVPGVVEREQDVRARDRRPALVLPWRVVTDGLQDAADRFRAGRGDVWIDHRFLAPAAAVRWARASAADLVCG